MPAADQSLVSMAAEYAQTLAMEQEPPKKEEPPSEAQQQAQAALDDVKIVIPDGMQVRSHKKKPQEDPDAVIKKMQDDYEKNNFEKSAQLEDSKTADNLDESQ